MEDIDKLRTDGRGRHLRVRLTPEEHEAFREAAIRDGITLSTWVRTTLRREAERAYARSGATAPWVKR